MMRAAISGFAVLCLCACSGELATGADKPGAHTPDEQASLDIRPADFAVLSCTDLETTLCLLVYAGGKRLLFGMPAGVAEKLGDGELASLDGLFVISLRPEGVEGLDEIRNRTWRAGRAERLDIVGPEGVSGLIDGLNLAYEFSDALVVVEDGAPRGGFDAALLETGLEVEGEQVVFDTGDLKVLAISSATGRATYRIAYRGIDDVWYDLLIQPCGGEVIGPGAYPVRPENHKKIACAGGDYGGDWPLKAPLFLVKTNR